MKRTIYTVVLGILLGIAIFIYLLYSEQQEATSYDTFHILFSGLAGSLVALSVSFISKTLNKLINWQQNTGLRLFAGLVLNAVTSFLLTSCLFISYILMTNELAFNLEDYKGILTKIAILIFILVLIYEVVYFAYYSYYSFATLQIETIRQERKQIELQLGALKSQLSPHFLFNSLNTISSLIFKDDTIAEKFIRKLAKMYNYTLKSYHFKLVTIDEELNFVKSYQYLLETRFTNKIKFDIDIQEAIINTKIPPLTLQMLIENAVKHNELNTSKPLNIKIFNDAKYITVQNNITKKPKNITSFNIGLKNISARYLLTSNKSITISNGENFTVKVPIIDA